MLLIVLFFYFLILKNKKKFFLTILITFILLISFNENLRYKYFDYTFQQLGIKKVIWNKNYLGIKRYYSKEHEDLSLTAFILFKDNILTGVGTKNFFSSCEKYKLNETETGTNYISTLNLNRNNKLTCSTHPHNLYFQLLAETGIFGFIYVFLLFIIFLYKNIKIILTKKKNNIVLSYYFLNTGILINLFPLIPSGSFFNNWMNLVLFFPLGMWLFINNKCKTQL